MRSKKGDLRLEQEGVMSLLIIIILSFIIGTLLAAFDELCDKVMDIEVKIKKLEATHEN